MAARGQPPLIADMHLKRLVASIRMQPASCPVSSFQFLRPNWTAAHASMDVAGQDRGRGSGRGPVRYLRHCLRGSAAAAAARRHHRAALGAGWHQRIADQRRAAAGLAFGSVATSARSPELSWLKAGSVPGSTFVQRQVARDALLDLRLLTRPDGAVAAAWFGDWKFAWPRDSSWVAAAFAATGHFGDSLRILRFIARVQDPSGTWAAKYTLSGTPVSTGLGVELDADGWFPWAVWIWYSEHRGGAAPRRALAGLWPAVRRAADTAAASPVGWRAAAAIPRLLGRPGRPADDWHGRTTARRAARRGPAGGRPRRRQRRAPLGILGCAAGPGDPGCVQPGIQSLPDHDRRSGHLAGPLRYRPRPRA